MSRKTFVDLGKMGAREGDDKWISEAMQLYDAHNRHDLEFMMGFGKLLLKMIETKTYRIVSKAGCHLASGLANKGYVIRLEFIYAAHKLVTQHAKSISKMVELAMPVRVAEKAAYWKPEFMEEVLEQVKSGLSWANVTEKYIMRKPKGYRKLNKTPLSPVKAAGTTNLGELLDARSDSEAWVSRCIKKNWEWDHEAIVDVLRSLITRIGMDKFNEDLGKAYSLCTK